MFERFKNAVNASAQVKWEVGLVTVASLLAGPAIIVMIYVAGHLFGLFEW